MNKLENKLKSSLDRSGNLNNSPKSHIKSTQLTQFNKSANHIAQKGQSRSITPINRTNISYNNIISVGDSSIALQDINVLKNFPKMPLLSNIKANTNTIQTSSSNNLHNIKYKKIGTPINSSKIDMKQFLMQNQQNNYTKKFIKKRSIDNLNNIGKKKEAMDLEKDKKSNSQERNDSLHRMTSSTINNNQILHTQESNCNNSFLNNTSNSNNITNRDNNILASKNNNLNINLSNVNINVNNNVSSLNNNLIVDKKFEQRKLSILDVGGVVPLIYEDNNKNEREIKNFEEENNQNIVESPLSLGHYKKSKMNKIFLNSLKNKYLKCLYIVCHSR